MKNLRTNLLNAALRTFALSATGGLAAAQGTISLNFTDSAAGSTLSTGTPGAVPIAASNWNNLNSVNGDGSLPNLKDGTGATTAAAINWISANTWRSGGTTVNGNGQLTKGYLDDGGGGSLVTVSNIPYLSYNAYVILATDTGGGTQGNANYSAININGLGYSHNDVATVQANVRWTGQNWTDSASLVEGQNYLKVANLGGLTLSVRGVNDGGFRGSIAGIQIQDSYAGSYSYWDLNGATSGAGGTTPAGTWSAATTNWNTAADGSAATAAWAGAGHAAVFAAGADATGSYTVTVSGTQNTDAVITEQGNVTLSGGTLNLSSPAVARAGSGSSLTINSALSGSSGVVLEGSGDISISGVHPLSGPAVISIPSLILNSGTSFPSLSSFGIGSGVSVIADTSSLTTTGGMSVANGSQVNSAGSTFNIGGDVNLIGAGFSGSGTTVVNARNLFMNIGTAGSSMALTNTATINLTSTLPAVSTFELDSGSLTMGDSSVLNTNRWVNRGTGFTQSLSVSGNAQLNVNGDLVFGDNSNAPITVTQSGGTVSNSGTSNNPGSGILSNRWGHWAGGDTVYNISAGALNITAAPLYLSWDGTAALNISGSAAVNLMGVDMGYGGRTNASTINLTGGQLNIGSAGIITGGTTNKSINLGAGTLGALATWASPLPMNATAAATINTGAFDIALSGGLNGSGSVTKLGAGTLGLTGTSSMTGPVTVNAGTLRLGGSLSGGASIAAGAALSAGGEAFPGLGTAATLSLANGSSSLFRLGASSDSIAVSAPSGLSTTTAHTINIAASPGIAPGTYTLFDYDTAIGGSGYAAFTLGSKPHIVASLNNNVPNSSVDLVITSIDSLVWKGNNGSAWDLNSSQNWALASNSSGAPYFQADLVLFNDSAATGNVVISGTITPGEVAFNNSTLAYTISGTGLGGTTDLLKDGTAKVTLTNPNTYSGSTVVSAGTLQVGNGSSGSLSPLSPVVVASGAEFIWFPAVDGNFGNPVLNDGIFRLTGTKNNSLSGAWDGSNPGEIIVDSTGITSFVTPKTNWSGNLTVNAGTTKVTGIGSSSLGTATNFRSLTFNGATTTLLFDGSNIFSGGYTLATSIPSIVLNGATLTATAYNVLGDITLNGGKISGASVDASTGYRGFELRGAITVTGTTPSLIETTTAHENHLDAATPFIVADVTSSSASDLLVTAPLRDASPDNGSIVSGLVKSGPGTLELAAANTYTGITEIQEGTVKVSGSLTVSSVMVASGATLGGGGSVAGTITVDSGAFLAPGASAGTLTAGSSVTLNGTLKEEVDGSAADRLNVTGALDITNATLDFSVLGGGANLGSYVIAQYGTLTGAAFATVSNLPAGYTLNYAFGPNSNQIAIVNPNGNPYLNWATGAPYNLSGGNELPGADPDKDGISNAIEFVLGGNPTTSNDASKLPTGAVSGGNFLFTFRRSDLSNYSPFPAVEYGSLLSGWTTAQNGVNGVVITVTDDFYGTGIDRVVVSIPQSLASGAKLFARLNANP